MVDRPLFTNGCITSKEMKLIQYVVISIGCKCQPSLDTPITLLSLFLSLEPCKHVLGMQNRRIPNSAITASSMWDVNHGPHLGRLHFTARGSYQGGWSARHNNRYQWFQVDFRRPTKITNVATQGRHNAAQWVTQYRLSYSQDGLTWALYKLRDGIKV